MSNLIRNPSFEQGLVGWQRSGPVEASRSALAFDREFVAVLDLVFVEHEVILQQQIIAPFAQRFQVSYAVKARQGQARQNGRLFASIRWLRRSDNLLLQEDALDQIIPGALGSDVSWLTRINVSNFRPTSGSGGRHCHRLTSPPAGEGKRHFKDNDPDRCIGERSGCGTRAGRKAAG